MTKVDKPVETGQTSTPGAATTTPPVEKKAKAPAKAKAPPVKKQKAVTEYTDLERIEEGLQCLENARMHFEAAIKIRDGAGGSVLRLQSANRMIHENIRNVKPLLDV